VANDEKLAEGSIVKGCNQVIYDGLCGLLNSLREKDDNAGRLIVVVGRFPCLNMVSVVVSFAVGVSVKNVDGHGFVGFLGVQVAGTVSIVSLD
jgi:hypothetical protein